jgi:protein required for attachment to host cells
MKKKLYIRSEKLSRPQRSASPRKINNSLEGKNGMKSTHIIIVADTGTLKAYRVSEKSLKNRKSAEVIKMINYEEAHTKLSDLLTDRAGRFRGSGDSRSRGHASGEEHNMKEDIKKKMVKHLVHDIEGIIKFTPAEFFYVSLPRAVHKNVMEGMNKTLRGKITKQVAADLIKAPVGELRERFKV